MAFVEFTKVDFSYFTNSTVLHNISFSIERTEHVMLAGTIGAGKSTALKLTVGLLAPNTGTIQVDGIRPSTHSLYEIVKRIGVALQNPSDQIFSSTVREEILYGLRNLGEKENSGMLPRVADLFGLSRLLDKHPYDLHPAQRRLLTLASAFAMNTPFYIFDEPTSGISKPERETISEALNQLRVTNKGYILITHDLAFGMEHCDRILVLNKGILTVNESLPKFLLRPNAQGILKKNGLEMPIVPRMSAVLAQNTITARYADFISQFRNQQRTSSKQTP
jgi:energy-coupling factor transporter ATP-binding protein EcfA2